VVILKKSLVFNQSKGQVTRQVSFFIIIYMLLTRSDLPNDNKLGL
jgi:hypothetical protein